MHSVFERIQIDLIDMSTTPDGEYKWILHIVDHFSKFSSSFALKSKHAVEVAEKLALWIGLFGPPHILQCDNGTEFKDAVLLLLKKYGIKVLNGWPRHPQIWHRPLHSIALAASHFASHHFGSKPLRIAPLWQQATSYRITLAASHFA